LPDLSGIGSQIYVGAGAGVFIGDAPVSYRIAFIYNGYTYTFPNGFVAAPAYTISGEFYI